MQTPVYIDVNQLPATSAGTETEELTPLPEDIQQRLLNIRTYRGADVDGALRTLPDGSLLVTLELRRWFDFHLSAQGEVPLNDIIEMMQSQILLLEQPARTQANDLLQAYLGYLAELQNYDEEQQKRVTEGTTLDMIERTRWQQRLRGEWFEPQVVDAFFAGDTFMDNYTIERLQAQRRGAAAEELQQLESKLPPELQEMRRQTRLVTNLRAEESRLRSDGADEQQIHDWRAQQFGEQTAQRLQQADERHKQWLQRLQQYLDYQNSLPVQGLDADDRQQLLQTYQQKHFTSVERKRLPAALALLNN